MDDDDDAAVRAAGERLGLALLDLVAEVTRSLPGYSPALKGDLGNAAPPQCWTIPEVAAALKVSKYAARQLIHSGVLKHLWIGKTYRVSDVELRRYITAAAISGTAG